MHRQVVWNTLCLTVLFFTSTVSAESIQVTQGEQVTLTLKLINRGDVPLKGITVQCDKATLPDWFVAEEVQTAVDVPINENPYVLTPFRFTIDKHAPLGEAEPITLLLKDAEASVWRKRFVLDVQPRPKPKVSRLLPNFPNPFNPETWIPYELKEAAPVQIRIYALSGKLVRTLHLGYKEADFYTSRSEAAYWDGRNETGEQAASGVYFYHLQAGRFSQVRKMLVLK